jgi:hypothetical protein
MKRPLLLILLYVFVVFTLVAEAQKRRAAPKPFKKPLALAPARESSNTAVVVDERLAVLRSAPSLFAPSIQRMRTGHLVSILGFRDVDGVTFCRVNAVSNNSGWVQSDALFSKFKRGDDERLSRLVQASDGFEQVERAGVFLDLYNESPLRPAILLLLGDLMEDAALKLSSDATKKLDRREMAASGAPLHSFYLNYVSLDRYRKIGATFVFNPTAKLFHYDGASWREIVAKFPKSSEAPEAQKRLDALKAKMETTKGEN